MKDVSIGNIIIHDIYKQMYPMIINNHSQYQLDEKMSISINMNKKYKTQPPVGNSSEPRARSLHLFLHHFNPPCNGKLMIKGMSPSQDMEEFGR